MVLRWTFSGSTGGLFRSRCKCQVVGFTSPLGSQNEVAGTKQRRSSNEPRQNALDFVLSLRTFVTRRGA